MPPACHIKCPLCQASNDILVRINTQYNTNSFHVGPLSFCGSLGIARPPVYPYAEWDCYYIVYYKQPFHYITGVPFIHNEYRNSNNKIMNKYNNKLIWKIIDIKPLQ